MWTSSTCSRTRRLFELLELAERPAGDERAGLGAVVVSTKPTTQ